MTIEQALSQHFCPGGLHAKTKLTTVQIMDILKEHIEIYDGQLNELAATLDKLGYKTQFFKNRIVWLIEVKNVILN